MQSNPQQIDSSIGVIDEDGSYIVCLTLRSQTEEEDWSNEMKFENDDASREELLSWVANFTPDKSRSLFVIAEGDFFLDKLSWFLTDHNYPVARLSAAEVAEIERANVEEPEQHLVQALAGLGMQREFPMFSAPEQSLRRAISFKKQAAESRRDTEAQIERVRGFDVKEEHMRDIQQLEAQLLNSYSTLYKSLRSQYQDALQELAPEQREVVEQA